MTATTEVSDDEDDDDINEGSITQIQILQNEQLDDLSPTGNEEVSAVSRAWFTSKEDKDSLTNKGRAIFTAVCIAPGSKCECAIDDPVFSLFYRTQMEAGNVVQRGNRHPNEQH
ncbi:hypothetical protein FKM82_018581 [Ascaphus truei]